MRLTRVNPLQAALLVAPCCAASSVLPTKLRCRSLLPSKTASSLPVRPSIPASRRTELTPVQTAFLAAEIPLCPKWPYPEASHVESFISGGYLNFPPPLDETLLRMANSYSGQICPVLPLSSFEPSLAQVLLSRPLEGLDIRLTKIGTADLVSTKVVLETPTQLRAMKAKKDSSHWWGTAVRVQGGDTPYKMVYALRFVKEGGGGAEVQELMRKVLEGKEGGFNPVELMPRRDGRLRSFDVPVGTRQMSKDGQFGVCVESFAGGCADFPYFS